MLKKEEFGPKERILFIFSVGIVVNIKQTNYISALSSRRYVSLSKKKKWWLYILFKNMANANSFFN